MPFLFAVIQPASQAWAKAALATARPELRFAFSRPGLTTWKSEPEIDPGAAIETPLARVWGRGIGSVKGADEIVAIASEQGATRLHAFARDAKEREEPSDEELARVAELERAVRASGVFLEGTTARRGERVLDVIVGGEGEGEIYVGVHEHGPGRIAEPGGRFAIDVPAEAPSRAYRKLEEMIAWAEIPIRAGDRAIELGAAPGGAALALVRRGVWVTAIDPAPIDPAVLAYEGPGGAGVRHFAIAAGAVGSEELEPATKWILSDVNLAPQVMLRYVERLASKLPRWEGLVLTMKLNDAKIASEIPALLDRVRTISGGEVRATQLASHRREIGVVALRDRGRR